MAKDLFSVPIFFIVFRETIEAAIIVSVLLGLVEQIVYDEPVHGVHLRHQLPALVPATTTAATDEKRSESASNSNEGGMAARDSESGRDEVDAVQDNAEEKRKLIRKMRIQIFAGSALGLLGALAIGAAFIAVWFTQASDLWASSEDLWEGIFELIASIIIFVMGVTMLKMDRAKAKWRIKLIEAFSGKRVDKRTRTSRWILFLLPFITVLREGLEAVVFVGGVSLGEPATSIPIAAICGLVVGLIVGFVIYTFASRSTLRIFMIVMTNLILLIGAGLFSRSIWEFESNAFAKIVGSDVDDTSGDGPGSFDVRNSVWHLDCCNPENNYDNGGWMIFNAIFGWTNSATYGSVIGYAMYWVAVMGALGGLKWKEGRMSFFGHESAIARQRREKRAARASSSPAAATTEGEKEKERSIASGEGSGERVGEKEGIEELRK
ncbi:iron permease FTR1 [Stereum hirsutum FP-91666 SS1]|uniref:iron permease FTR1 n=1 Tax=Stereum hirsutum (strain FP-91666) TaxID=721885 RepID=UPI0004449BA0|nr:iron permease FTR1 [Stereum hirsutum FP-91666 SS1]EIM82005.1 iron permease FTR1 [Stereum hirsutum FP-91666 SS1]